MSIADNFQQSDCISCWWHFIGFDKCYLMNHPWMSVCLCVHMCVCVSVCLCVVIINALSIRSYHISSDQMWCDVIWCTSLHIRWYPITSHHITSHQMISDDITSNDIRWYHIISDDIRCFYIPTPVPLIVFCLKEMLNIGWISLGRYLIVGRYLLHTPLDITGYPPQQQSIFGRYHITSDNIWWYKLKSEDIWWYQKISEDIYISDDI